MCVTSSNRGFTLLEILIAVALLGILSAALYGSYFTVLRARDRAADGMEARRELGATLDLLRREVASARFNRSDARLRFVVEDRDNFGKPASRMEFTTLAPPSNQGAPESGVMAVSYQMTEKDRRSILTRKEQDLFFQSATVTAYPQMESLSAFLVECYDGSKWVRSWDTALNGTLPKSVRITLRQEEDGTPVEFSMLSAPMVSQP